MPNSKSARFIEWFAAPGESIDGRSQVKACALFESGITESIEAGTVKGLRQIHAWLFGGLYDFAGQIRTKNIAKGGFQFAMARYLPQTLRKIESMPDGIFDEIVTKYVEMNVAHPFMEGNGRSARIWLDLILKKRLGKCVDWSKISKNDYLNAMKKSVADESAIRSLLQGALTDKINDRETFMKGIERSYQYEDAE
ncbi:MAG: Fic family protein [Synergistes sp.]|nr:Fic family protein [Synergistes sp.]